MSRFASALSRASVSVVAAGLCAASLLATAGGASAATVNHSLRDAVIAPSSVLSVPIPPASAFAASPASFAHPAAATAWTVSLVADNTDISEGQQATLTAYVNQPLNGSGKAIYIYGFSQDWPYPRLMNNGPCDTGSSCQATVNWEANPVGYRAFVADNGEAFNLVEDNADVSSNLVTIGPARYIDESQLSEFNRLMSGIWEVP